MAANLSTRNGRRTMAYAGITGSVWHNSGQDVRERQTAGAMLTAAEMDYLISTRPVRFQGAEGGAFDLDAGALRVIVRDDTNAVLGYATKSYNPIQNTSCAESVEAILGAGCHAETAGALGLGERCWILSHLDSSDFELPGGDVVKPYLLAFWGHDGRTPLTFRLTGTRVVCQNTADVALSGTKAAVKIKHQASAALRIDEARTALGLIRKAVPEMADAFKALCAKSVTTSAARDYFANLFPYPAAAQVGETDGDTIARLMGAPGTARRSITDAARKAMERTDETRGLLLRLFDGAGMGADLASARGTAWGAYNAVSEYIDHAYPVLASGKVSQDRLESAMVGAYADKRREAFDAALAMA